jgi:hypothetical protein
MFVIARGAVHVLTLDDGREVVVDVLGGGDIIGEMSLLAGTARTASIRAATSVTLGRIERDAFEHLMQTQPALREKIWEAFGRRTFDNFVRAQPRFAHLDHDDRAGWFGSGEHRVLAPGEAQSLEPSHDFVFLLTGSVQSGGRSYAAPALIEVDGQSSLRAVALARVSLLPGPLSGPAASDRMSLSDAAMKDALG